MYRKYRTRGPRKTRRKNPKKRYGQTIVIKSGSGKKAFLILALLGGAGFAAYYYRDKLGIKMPDFLAKNKSPLLNNLYQRMLNVKAAMQQALNAGDEQAYIDLQEEYEIAKLEFESERDL